MRLFRRFRRSPGNTDLGLPPPYSAVVQNSHIDKADYSQCTKVSEQTTQTAPLSLADFPNGILLKIKAYLSPAFQAALALTNRHLLRTIGTGTLLLSLFQ